MRSERPLVKICGVCRPGDAALAAEAGADYVGVILSPGFRRHRSDEEARAILDQAGGLRRVGVFVDAPEQRMLAAAESLRLDVIQLHGSEPPELALRLGAAGLEVWKALRPRGRTELEAGLRAYRGAASGLLVEGHAPGAAGGTGTAFPWARWASPLADRGPDLRLIAAGGLRPANVALAIAELDPDVVDVSSGVEEAPGRKDPARVRSFVDAAHGARAAGGRR